MLPADESQRSVAVRTVSIVTIEEFPFSSLAILQRA